MIFISKLGIKCIFLFLIVLFLPYSDGKAQLPLPLSPDSLFRVRSHQSGLERARTNLLIANYYHINKTDSLAHYTELLERFLGTERDKQIEAYTYKFKGDMANDALESDTALSYFRKSLKIFNELKNFEEMGWISGHLSKVYYTLGDISNALENCRNEIKYFELAGNNIGIANAYHLLGRINYSSGRYSLALENLDQALNLNLENGAISRTYKIYNSMGLLHLAMGDSLEALDHFRIAEKGYREIKRFNELSLVYSNLAECFGRLNEVDSALYYLGKAISLSEKIDNVEGKINGYKDLSYYLRKSGDLDSSLSLLKKAFDLARRYSFLELEQSIFREYEDLYLESGDYKNAYLKRLSGDSIEEMMFNKQTQEQIDKLNFSYKNRIEEQKLKRLRLERTNQKRITHLLIIVLIIFLGLILLLINGFNQNRKHRKLLTDKNNLLNQYNDKLEKSEKELTKVIDDKNKIFSIIAHDLRNPLATVTGFVDLLDENYAGTPDATLRDYIRHISKASFRAMNLLENLLFWARSQMDKIEVKNERVDIEDLVNDSIEPLISLSQEKEIKVEMDEQEKFDLLADKQMLAIVLRNLVSNAIKFSYPKSKIIIRMDIVDHQKCISVIDFGVGISDSNKNRLLTSRHLTSSAGTNNEKGSGLGLAISRDFVNKNGGNLRITDSPGSGSTFTICFPE